MRRIAFALCSALLVSSPPGVLGALDPPSSEPAKRDGGVSAFTDAAGNPVPRETQAGGAEIFGVRAVGDPAREGIRRGQTWWPYGTGLPPYTAVDKRVEELGEDEIVVNGVITLGTHDAHAALAAVPPDLLLAPDSQLQQEVGYYLVKIAGFTRTQVEVGALEDAGALLGEFININTYIARIPSRDHARVSALPFVTFVGDYHPAYKISPRIGLELIPTEVALDPQTGEPNPWTFEVWLHAGADLGEVLHDLATLGIVPAPEDVVVAEGLTALLVRTEPENVPFLAKIPGVKWIAERAYPRLHASSTSPTVVPMLLQNDGVFTTNTALGWKLWNAGIDGDRSGTAQVVTVMDTGLNTNMEHFSQSTTTAGTVGPAHRKVVGYDNFGGDVCVTNYTTADGGHGTWTSQHAVGSISNMTSNPDTTHTPTTHYDSGIASAAKLYFQDFAGPSGAINPPLDLSPSLTAAIGKGSAIHSNSWSSNAPTYDTQASNLDTALFANPSMVVTASAGNDGTSGTGTIGSPCTAKNAICVGGVDAASPNSLFEHCGWDGNPACGGVQDLGSARGPVTGSGRVKPDICAYMAFSANVGGENEAGDRPHAMCQTDPTKTVYWDWFNTNGFGGTSFSAPEIAGLAALVRDYFQAGFYPTGSATPPNALTPTGPLVKALLLAAGEDLAATASPSTSITVAKRYSSDAGYGRANLPGVLHIGSGAPFLWVQNGDALGDGATKTTFYNINGNGMPLRVMLAYYDAAGNALQKDCDLKVTVGSTVYWGNNFSAGWSTSATSTRDHTNNTEGVFLDAAHGLPASGTIRVDVIGFSNPGGMTYSLVVAGDVASQAVTQVSLDRGSYNCGQAVGITVNDVAGSSPVSVTLTSKNSGGSVIDTESVSCTGSNGVFSGSILTGSGITVADGGSLTATYASATPAVSGVDCQIALSDGGFLINGGCDNQAAGTNFVTSPLSSGGVNEYYTRYMDGGEYTSYTVGFNNLEGADLTDVEVSLSFSGAGASKMSVLNNPVHVGALPSGDLTGAVFQVFTDPSVAGLASVNLDFDITSPADGFTAPRRLTQTQLLQANDTVARQSQCSPFNTALTPWFESVVTCSGCVANPWRWIGSATTPATVGSENRTDGSCGNATANAGAMVGNSGTGVNFAANANSFLLQRFQPALRGNGPSGQPYRYTWKWHSFYHASEALGNQGGVWGAFYHDEWNLAVNPTADQALSFPIQVAYFYHTVFDHVGTWDWEAANSGTPDDPQFGPTSGGAPNQLHVTFSPAINGVATNDAWFAYGHQHADIVLFGGTGARRDIALDNERLVYDEYYATAQGAACSSPQPGQVAFDRYTYAECPASAVLSVLDANATGPLTVTVTSPGTGDSETLQLTGSAPYFSGSLALAADAGAGDDDGVLFVLPSETINASYVDGSPAGSSTAVALVACVGAPVVYVSNAQIADNGDNDGRSDNNETVTLDLTIRNDMATALTNTRVTLSSETPGIDCVGDGEALYGTVAGGATATNPPSDRFVFHVAPSVACSDWQVPPTATFTVVITGDGIDGPAALQRFTIDLDLDATSGGTFTHTQGFASDPGWATGATPDDSSTCSPTYANNFHWCAACGSAGAGYGAWVGSSAFGTPGQNYVNFDSSTLYSPQFVANGTVTLRFDVAYRTETSFDGALVQYRLGAGSWTTLAYTTPSQSATTSSDGCSPLAVSAVAWHGTTTGTSWTTTNAASVPASAGQSIQFRWRLGSDESVVGSGYGGLGVDNVIITGLKQVTVCEPTRNTGLPSPAPPEVSGVVVERDGVDTVLSWSPASGATEYDVLRGLVSGLPVGPGGGDEVCIDEGTPLTTVTDSDLPPLDDAFWYDVRGVSSSCGPGPYGHVEVDGVPTDPRVTTTCLP